MKEIANYYSQARENIVTFVPKNIRSILDIGCGRGLFLKLIKEQTRAETWGIEMVNEVANIAIGNTDKILIGKIEDVYESIPDNYFDCITFNDVLEHLLEPIDVLIKVKSKLSDNGIVIVSVPNVRYLSNLFGLIIKKDWKYTEYGILDSTHLRFFTEISIKRMFKEAGYQLILMEGNPLNISWKFRIFDFFTLGFFRDAKYFQFTCVAKPI